MNLEGVFPPIPTPFTNESVDHQGLARNVARWMQTKLAGLVVLGSNGEAPLLDDAESDAIIETVRAHVPRDRTLIGGVGRESTAATIAAAKRAARIGVDVILVRTPSFYKNVMTSDAFVRYYTAVADASPAPVLLYNVSVFTGVNLLPDAVERLAAHPNIIGMKESNADLVQLAETIARTPDDFVVLGGSAPTFYHALCAGADGGVLAISGVVPDICVELFESGSRAAACGGACAPEAHHPARAPARRNARRRGLEIRTGSDWFRGRADSSAARDSAARRTETDSRSACGAWHARRAVRTELRRGRLGA